MTCIFAKCLHTICEGFAMYLPTVCRVVANCLQTNCERFAEYLHLALVIVNCLQSVCKIIADTLPAVCRLLAAFLKDVCRVVAAKNFDYHYDSLQTVCKMFAFFVPFSSSAEYGNQFAK